MKRVFIIREDLPMSPGQVAQQVGRCAEAYWTHGFKEKCKPIDDGSGYTIYGIIDRDIVDDYICKGYDEVICKAGSKAHLLEAKKIAEKLELEEGVHYGLIYDKNVKDIKFKKVTNYEIEKDEPCLTAIWFCPLSEVEADMISRHYYDFGSTRR